MWCSFCDTIADSTVVSYSPDSVPLSGTSNQSPHQPLPSHQHHPTMASFSSESAADKPDQDPVDVFSSQPSASLTWETQFIQYNTYSSSSFSSTKCIYSMRLYPSISQLSYEEQFAQGTSGNPFMNPMNPSPRPLRTWSTPTMANIDYKSYAAISLNGSKKNQNEHLFVRPGDHLYVHYRFSILNHNGEKCNIQEGCEPFLGCSQSITTIIISRSNLDSTQDGKLTVYCEIFELNKQTSITNIATRCLFSHSKNQQALLDSGKDADVVLMAGGVEHKAHKLILSAHSPVFSAMFDHGDTKEALEGKVEMIDMSAGVLAEMLMYIYSIKTPNLQLFAPELLAAADQYALNSLKSLCAQYLSSHLEVDSVADTLLLADLHQEAELKSKCIEFITDRSDQVMATDGWSRLVATKRIDLVVELFQKVTVKRKIVN